MKEGDVMSIKGVAEVGRMYKHERSAPEHTCTRQQSSKKMAAEGQTCTIIGQLLLSMDGACTCVICIMLM